MLAVTCKSLADQTAVSLDAAVAGEELSLAARVEGVKMLVFDTCHADTRPVAGGGPGAAVVWPGGGLHSLLTLCAGLSRLAH